MKRLGPAVIALFVLLSLAPTADAQPRVVVLGSADSFVPRISDPVRESVRSADHKVRCVASFPSAVLEPGYETGAGMFVKNVTDQNVKVYAGFLSASLILRDAGGNLLYDTGYWPFSSPFALPNTLKPGETAKLWPRDVVVRWDGAISITPICSVGHEVTFPPLAFAVAVPPGLPDAPTALASALDQTAGLFTSCVPDAAGSETIGSIPPPLGHKPALDSKCWAKITAHPGFYVIDLFFVSPSSLPAVELPVGPNWADLPGGKKSAEAVRFGFVVSSLGATPYDSMMRERTRTADKMMPYYELESGVWGEGGLSRCGGDGLTWGRGVFVAMITACPA